jgi:hypothetical protein
MRITDPGGSILTLVVTAYAMAISSALCGALLVENGQRLARSDAFVSQQWLWFNVAAVASAFLGGELVSQLAPGMALHARPRSSPLPRLPQYRGRGC